MRRYLPPIILVALVASPVFAQVYRPNPSATAQPDTGVSGLAQPTVVPSCAAGQAFQYADANGCVYVCAGAKTTIIARPLNNTCAVPTTGATATLTPTPTVTVTP